jgi:hypothetical protein
MRNITNPIAINIKPISKVLSEGSVPRTINPKKGPNAAMTPMDTKKIETLLIKFIISQIIISM